MRGCLGWLLLLPLAGAFWLVITIANACVKKGGLWRLLGVLVSFAIGGACIGVGFLFGSELGLSIFRWIAIIAGGLIAILGTWTVLAGTKEEIEVREEMEKLEKEMRKLDEGKKDEE